MGRIKMRRKKATISLWLAVAVGGILMIAAGVAFISGQGGKLIEWVKGTSFEGLELTVGCKYVKDEPITIDEFENIIEKVKGYVSKRADRTDPEWMYNPCLIQVELKGDGITYESLMKKLGDGTLTDEKKFCKIVGVFGGPAIVSCNVFEEIYGKDNNKKVTDFTGDNGLVVFEKGEKGTIGFNDKFIWRLGSFCHPKPEEVSDEIAANPRSIMLGVAGRDYSFCFPVSPKELTSAENLATEIETTAITNRCKDLYVMDGVRALCREFRLTLSSSSTIVLNEANDAKDLAPSSFAYDDCKDWSTWRDISSNFERDTYFIVNNICIKEDSFEPFTQAGTYNIRMYKKADNAGWDDMIIEIDGPV